MSTNEQPAQFAFLTMPQPGHVVLNVQIKGEEIQRFVLNRDQQFRINADSANYLCQTKGKK